MKPSLGTVEIDLPKLIETRLLVQCNSGGGKSFCLRRVLEQTAPHVQQLVIDPEGEFASLREKHDYIVCAPRGADAVANPQTAAALALALWQARTSAILDIYELKAHERVLFVRRFLEALVNAPRAVWNPALVVIDEAHIFAPQGDRAESLGAVIDLATRGRKRGLALLAATQRISKLHKDVAAELLNKLIGRTGLDVDVRRAADELGMSNMREATETLRNLSPGEFFVFGPALSRGVERTKIGPVQTTHPETGKRALVAPPPPSAKVRAQLAKIEGLQRDAEDEVKTVASLSADLATARRKLTLAEKAQGGGVPEAEVQRRVREAAAAAPVAGIPASALRAVAKAIAALQEIETNSGITPLPAVRSVRAAVPRASAPPSGPAVIVEGLRAGATRILAELAARAPAGYSRYQVGALTQFSPKGGTFNTYLSDLRRGGFIEERAGLVYATEHGITQLGDRVPAKPTSHEEAMALWRKALRSGAFSMLEAVVRANAHGLARSEVADAVGMQMSGGTFNTYLGDLRRNGLIVERDKRCIANDILFPGR
jgi:hypothetical protein